MQLWFGCSVVGSHAVPSLGFSLCLGGPGITTSDKNVCIFNAKILHSGAFFAQKMAGTATAENIAGN